MRKALLVCGILASVVHAASNIIVTLTDTLHIAWTVLVVPLMMLQIAFGSAVFGRGFRIYSVLTIATMIVFGAVTGVEAPNIATNGPTPIIGVWERIGIVAQMVWVPMFAARLLRL